MALAAAWRLPCTREMDLTRQEGKDEALLLQPGDLITRFDGATVDGRVMPYDRLWQRRNMVLFVLSADLGAASLPYLRALENRLSELKPPDTLLVISDHAVDGRPVNSVTIADRWGEIVHIEQLASNQEAWPSIADILEWVEFIRAKCPECPP